ncbi:hypothetical protein CPB86DRAFT_780661 [Serendipita vermifera]|nr:hypothetical protein CPB86DRAFT_780661 [Serendipita vermifera]
MSYPYELYRGSSCVCVATTYSSRLMCFALVFCLIELIPQVWVLPLQTRWTL